jgi:pimeloyl-ACP methyl ester carboxylesterase
VLNAIAQQHPGEPINFVTHSLGGLIVRATVNHPKCPYEAKIGKAILLAPPNQGAALARRFQGCPMIRWIFGKKAGTQLLTYSAEDMSNLGQFPQTMQVMVIAGEKGTFFYRHWEPVDNDGKVSVEETRLNSPHDHKVLRVGHSWIMTSRQSIALTKEFLLRKAASGYLPNAPAAWVREGASAKGISESMLHSPQYQSDVQEK